MANPSVEIVIKATDKASKVFDNVNTAADRTAKKGLEQAKVALAGIGAAAGVATAAIIAAKKVFEFGKEGAQLELTAGRFDRLAESIDTTGDSLMNDLRPAMGGMMSDAEMMAAATDMMSLGLAKSHEEAVRLASVAGQLGMNMNQLVLTLTNKTTMRFDALGVAVDGFDKKVKDLEATGMSADAAFQEAFLQQAEAQLERVGSAADTAAGEFAQLEAAWKNMTDSAKKNTADALLPLIRGINDMTDLERALAEAVDLGIISKQEEKKILEQVHFGLLSVADATEMLVEKTQELKAEIEALAGPARSADDAMLGYANHLMEVANETTHLRDMTQEGEVAFDRYGTAQEKAARSAELGAHAAMFSRKEQEKLNKALTETERKLNDVDTALRDTIDTYKEQIEWIAGGGQLLVEHAETIMEAYGKELIDADPALQALDAVKMGAIDLDLELGNITTEEAVKELEGMGYPVDIATAKVAALQNSLFALTMQDYVVNVTVKEVRQAALEGPQGWNTNLGSGGGIGGQKRAMGGPVLSNMPYMVGEQGPEMFIPGQSGTIVPNNQMGGSQGALGGGETNINIYGNTNSRMDITALAYEVAALLGAR